jgi:acetylcholinesterase
MWTNFAKYGNPTPREDRTILDFQWSPVHKHKRNEKFQLDYLEIGSDSMEMQRNPDDDRIQFWRNTVAKWNGDFLKAKL